MYKELIDQLSKLPSHWRLIAVNGKKSPYETRWTLGRSREHIELEIELERAKGYGLLTGRNSGGVVAVDCDGDAAHVTADQLGGLPETISFTSGKRGRAQYLYQIPQEYWGNIQTVKINTGVKDNGKNILLELRWDGCQSVLPPSVHPETGAYTWINDYTTPIAQAPQWVIEQMLKESSPAIPFQPPAVPLELCISKTSRDLLNSGAVSGSRNDAGAKLARDLIGTETRLRYLGIDYQGIPRLLFDNFCSLCQPSLSNRENSQIWRSAEKSNPVASLTDEMILNCVKSYQRKQAKQTNAIEQTPKKTPQIETTSDIEEEEPDVVQEELLTTATDSLPESVLLTLLGKQLHNAQKLKAQGFGIDPAVLSVGTLLLFGSQISADTKLILNELTDYSVSANWCAVGIGETGTMKSPIYDSSFSPLAKVQFKNDQAYNEKLENYQRALIDYRKCRPEDDQDQPVEPIPTELYVDNFTIESVMECLKARPNLALCSDEVTSIFNGLGQYQCGKGNSRQMLLKLLSNGAIKLNRKGSGRLSLPRTSIALWGMTQPSVWAKDLQREETEDGLHSRIALYAIPKGHRVTYSNKSIDIETRSGKIDISGYLSKQYESAAELASVDVALSPEARKVWQEWDEEIYNLIDSEPDSRIRSLYPKAKARAGSIALGSHLLNYCQYRKQSLTELSAEILKAAIAYTKWLLNQTKSLYASWGIGVGKETADITKLLSKLKSKTTGDGWVDTRFVQRSMSLPSAEKTRELMQVLIDRGLAERNPAVKKLEIRLIQGKKPVLSETCQSLSEPVSDKPNLDTVNDIPVLSECQTDLENNNISSPPPGWKIGDRARYPLVGKTESELVEVTALTASGRPLLIRLLSTGEELTRFISKNLHRISEST